MKRDSPCVKMLQNFKINIETKSNKYHGRLRRVFLDIC